MATRGRRFSFWGAPRDVIIAFLFAIAPGNGVAAVPDFSVILHGKHWADCNEIEDRSLAWSFAFLNLLDDKTLLASVENYLGKSLPVPETDTDGSWVRNLDVGILNRLRFGASKDNGIAYGNGGMLLEGAWTCENGYMRLRPSHSGSLSFYTYHGLTELQARIASTPSTKKPRSTIAVWL